MISARGDVTIANEGAESLQRDLCTSKGLDQECAPWGGGRGSGRERKGGGWGRSGEGEPGVGRGAGRARDWGASGGVVPGLGPEVGAGGGGGWVAGAKAIAVTEKTWGGNGNMSNPFSGNEERYQTDFVLDLTDTATVGEDGVTTDIVTEGDVIATVSMGRDPDGFDNRTWPVFLSPS
ncbi:hypothetical protein TIFTF001_015521 [Ficus carica]|uniref:Uncharacterized protein n=1 Tax=Ficus carica TaxID=3494 RepID=A0AA88D912_FICCA|nr:hypothetical protein TIFTF001_015521 [Ficus carica]